MEAVLTPPADNPVSVPQCTLMAAVPVGLPVQLMAADTKAAEVELVIMAVMAALGAAVQAAAAVAVQVVTQVWVATAEMALPHTATAARVRPVTVVVVAVVVVEAVMKLLHLLPLLGWSRRWCRNIGPRVLAGRAAHPHL